MQERVLIPGDYLVEIAFERPCQREALEKALRSAGFSDITFDAVDQPVRTGALIKPGGLGAATSKADVRAPAPSPTSLAATPIQAVSTVTKAVQAAQVANPERVAQPAPSMVSPTLAATPIQAVAPVTKAVQAAQAIDPTKIAPPKPSAPPMIDPNKYGGYDGAALRPIAPKEATLSPGFRQAQKLVQAPKPASKYDQPAQPVGRPGDRAPAPEPEPAYVDEPVYGSDEELLYENAAYDGGGGGGGGDGGGGGGYGEVERDVYRPSEVEREVADVKTLRVLLLWQRWVEWGSPFATSPGGNVDAAALAAVNIAGEVRDEDAPSATRVRFLGRLSRPITIQDPPGMRWMLAIRLGVDPFRTLDWQAPSYVLQPRAFYEMRLLVREKAAPTRQAVKELLASMGFAPAKLSLVQRNVRLPNKPTSLAAWVAIGQWLHPESVVTVEDPFWFEQVKEVRA